MVKIKYPEEKPAIRNENGTKQVFCIIRKRWMLLTPEEWVRQNLILYLTIVLKYPSSLIAVEKQVLSGELKRRFDIVVYRDDTPWMLIECKEMNVELTPAVLDQVLRYNSSIQAGVIVISNGSHCYAYEKNGMNFREMDSFPSFA